MTEKKLSVNENNIAYWDNELDSEFTLLFIHGNSLSKESFAKQFEGTPSHRYIAVDLPGHGSSDRSKNPEEDYTVPGFSTTLCSFLSALNLKNVVLVGHSLGGHIAIEMANSLNSLKGLVIFGTPPLAIPPDMASAFLPNPAMAAAFKGELSQEETNLLAQAFCSDQALTQNLARQINQTDPNSRTSIGASIGQLNYTDEIVICKDLSVDFAVLHGAKDPLVNQDYFSSKFPKMWKGAVQIIQEAGHSIQLETPEEFSEILSAYLNDLSNT